jgi:hypothetical protein
LLQLQVTSFNVLPLDWRAAQRMNFELMGRPSLGGDATT